MATTSLIEEIDDKFCLCSICLEQLKEPKLLPCLHRFCKDCLDKLLQASRGTFKCPECREEIQIPTNGVDGFKTDFYMSNLVEHVQIQQSLQSDEIRECYSCLKYLIAAAYCFKCNNFLCTDCHHAHVTNNTLKDHKQHTLSVEDIESKNITPEKLASMRDAPRCHVHPSKVSELYCETCDNEPACVACMVGKHKGHDLHEVTELARVKRQMLTEQLKMLHHIKGDSEVKTPSKLKEKLIQNVANEKQKLQTMYENEVLKEEKELQNIKRRRENVNDLKKNKKQKLFDCLQSEREKEIQEVRNKYKKMHDEKENEINHEFLPVEIVLEKKIIESSQRLEQFDKNKKELLQVIEIQLKEKFQTIETIMEHLEKEDKQFQKLNVIASNILASENDWTAVKCIPDLCSAAINLMNNLKKEFPELDKLTNVQIDYQQSFKGKPCSKKIVEQVEKKVTIDRTYKFVYGATRSGDGNVVITGCSQTGKETFVIVMDVNGKIVKQKKLNARTEDPRHYCAFISQHRVALACKPNTIVVYNVRDGSYFRKIISDVISSWPEHQEVISVATDLVNNHILVGGFRSRDVYVFDDQLNYLHILTLPEIIHWPQDMTVSDRHLLVCDYVGKKAYMTTMEGKESKVVCEFMKPDLGVDGLGPRSVCTDKDGFVYMLWDGKKCYLVQYIYDGSQILKTREVDKNAMVVAAVETAEGEKLFVATHSKQTVYSYDLIEDN